MSTVPASPYPYPLPPRDPDARVALVIIDMQRDFVEPGGFGAALGNNVQHLQRIVPTVAKLLATLHALNPAAAMFGSIKGVETPLPAFDRIEPENTAAIMDEPDKPAIFPAKILIDSEIDWTAFSVWLSALLHARGNEIVRVKGVVRTPAGRLLVQTVRKTIQSPEILPEQDDRSDREDGAIVFIGRGYKADDLTRSLRYFAGTEPLKPWPTEG